MQLCLCRLIIVLQFGLVSLAQGQTSQTEQNNRKLKITNQPQASYTVEARKAHVEGEVRLKVNFLANGSIGDIACINEDGDAKEKLTKYGLVSSAISAARKITFEPEVQDGSAANVKRTIIYSFSLY